MALFRATTDVTSSLLLREVTVSLQCLKSIPSNLLYWMGVLFAARAPMRHNYQFGKGMRKLRCP